MFNDEEIKRELQKIEQWKYVVKAGGVFPSKGELPGDDFTSVYTISVGNIQDDDLHHPHAFIDSIFAPINPDF